MLEEEEEEQDDDQSFDFTQTLQVKNVMAVINLGKVIADLRGISDNVPQTELMALAGGEVNALSWRHADDQNAAALLFESGKLVLAGATSLESTRKFGEDVVNTIKMLGFGDGMPSKFKLEVKNIVAWTNIGCPIDLA